jgi:hypothetical protein
MATACLPCTSWACTPTGRLCAASYQPGLACCKVAVACGWLHCEEVVSLPVLERDGDVEVCAPHGAACCSMWSTHSGSQTIKASLQSCALLEARANGCSSRSLAEEHGLIRHSCAACSSATEAPGGSRARWIWCKVLIGVAGADMWSQVVTHNNVYAWVSQARS